MLLALSHFNVMNGPRRSGSCPEVRAPMCARSAPDRPPCVLCSRRLPGRSSPKYEVQPACRFDGSGSWMVPGHGGAPMLVCSAASHLPGERVVAMCSIRHARAMRRQQPRVLERARAMTTMPIQNRVFILSQMVPVLYSSSL